MHKNRALTFKILAVLLILNMICAQVSWGQEATNRPANAGNNYVMPELSVNGGWGRPNISGAAKAAETITTGINQLPIGGDDPLDPPDTGPGGSFPVLPVVPGTIIYTISSTGATVAVAEMPDGGQLPIAGIMQGGWAILGTDNGALLFVDVNQIDLSGPGVTLPAATTPLMQNVGVITTESIIVYQRDPATGTLAANNSIVIGQGDTISIYGFSGEFALVDPAQGLFVNIQDILPSLQPLIAQAQNDLYGDAPQVYQLTEGEGGSQLTPVNIDPNSLVRLDYFSNGAGEVFVTAANPRNLAEVYYIPLGSLPISSALLDPSVGPTLYQAPDDTPVYNENGQVVTTVGQLTGVSRNEGGIVVVPNGLWLDIVHNGEQTYRIPSVPITNVPASAAVYATTATGDEEITLQSLYEVTDSVNLEAGVFVLGDSFVNIQGVACVPVASITNPENIYFVPVRGLNGEADNAQAEAVQAMVTNPDRAQVYAPVYVPALDYFLSLTFNSTSDDPRIAGFGTADNWGTYDALSYNGNYLMIDDVANADVDHVIEMLVDESHGEVYDYRVLYDSIDPSLRAHIAEDMVAYGLDQSNPEVYSFITGTYFQNYSGLDNPVYVTDSLVLDLAVVLNDLNARHLADGSAGGSVPIYAMSFDIGVGFDLPDTVASDFPGVQSGINFYGLTMDDALNNLEENYGVPRDIGEMLAANFYTVPVVAGLNVEMFGYNSADAKFSPILSTEEAGFLGNLPPVITGYDPVEGYTLSSGANVSFDSVMVSGDGRSIMVCINSDLDLWISVAATDAGYDDVRPLLNIDEGSGGFIGFVQGAFEHVTDIGDVVIGSIVLDAGALFGNDNMKFVGGEMLINSVWFQHLNDLTGGNMDGSRWAEITWGIDIAEGEVLWQDYFDNYTLFTLVNDMLAYGYENGDAGVVAAADTIAFFKIVADIYGFRVAGRLGGMLIGGPELGQLNTIRGGAAFLVTRAGPTVMMGPMYADMGTQLYEVMGSLFEGEFGEDEFISVNNLMVFVLADAGANTLAERGSFQNGRDAVQAFGANVERSFIIIGTAAAGDLVFDAPLAGAYGGMGAYSYSSFNTYLRASVEASGSNRVVVVMGEPDITTDQPLSNQQVIIRGDPADPRGAVQRLASIAENIGQNNPDLEVTVLDWNQRGQLRGIITDAASRGEKVTVIFIGHGDIQLLPENIGRPIDGITVRNASVRDPTRLLDYNDWVNPRTFVQEFQSLGVRAGTVDRFCIASCGVAYPNGQPEALPGQNNRSYLHQVAQAFPGIQFEGPNHIASFQTMNVLLMTLSGDIMAGLSVAGEGGTGRIVELNWQGTPVMPGH